LKKKFFPKYAAQCLLADWAGDGFDQNRKEFGGDAGGDAPSSGLLPNHDVR
jgi:hypothetical protein